MGSLRRLLRLPLFLPKSTHPELRLKQQMLRPGAITGTRQKKDMSVYVGKQEQGGLAG